MTTKPIVLSLFQDNSRLAQEIVSGSIELGRQLPDPSEKLYVLSSLSGSAEKAWRWNIASREETWVTRRIRLDPLDNGLVRVTNFSSGNRLKLLDQEPIECEGSRELTLPFVMIFARKSVRVEADNDEPPDLQSLGAATIAPGGMRRSAGRMTVAREMRVSDAEFLVDWFSSVTTVLQSAASSTEFLQYAANALVNLLRMTTGRCLLYLPESQTWEMSSVATANDSPLALAIQPSKTVLKQVLHHKRTFWQAIEEQQLMSLHGVQAVVAAPILNAQGDVIGALYGDRLSELGASEYSISKIEAQLVEILACGVAGGLARIEQEKSTAVARQEATKWQGRLAQFFTADLARRLETDPDLLRARDADITVLFCDVNGFSSISETQPASITLEWINAVLTCLSKCVLAHDGVLVDYIGDELMAMWGAPEPRADHARLASLAAADMLKSLDELNAIWQSRLGKPIRVHIGINSGTASVGNVGSEQKFKYGPLGHIVNVASRAQGCTKYLGVDQIVTKSTWDRLGPNAIGRRLTKARLVNMKEPIELYQLAEADSPEWVAKCLDYEKALTSFESKVFHKAAYGLSELLLRHPNDGPTMALLGRAVRELLKQSDPFDPAWEPSGK